jgi:hypothetical protein
MQLQRYIEALEDPALTFLNTPLGGALQVEFKLTHIP